MKISRPITSGFVACLVAFQSVAPAQTPLVESFDIPDPPPGGPILQNPSLNVNESAPVWTFSPANPSPSGPLTPSYRSKRNPHTGNACLYMDAPEVPPFVAAATVRSAASRVLVNSNGFLVSPDGTPGTTFPNGHVLWFDFWARPAADPAPEGGANPPSAQISVGQASLTLVQDVAEPATVSVFRTATISFVDGTTSVPLGKVRLRFESLTALDWHRFTLRQDLGISGTGRHWDFYLDGVLMGTGLALPVGSDPAIAFRVAAPGQVSSHDFVTVDDLAVSETSPLFADADNDGLADTWEATFGLPTDGDSRAATVLGQSAVASFAAFTVKTPIGTDASLLDSDLDGMTDAYEMQYGLNPTDPADAALDYDGDGSTNLQEFKFGTTPKSFPLFRAEILPLPSSGIPSDTSRVNMSLLCTSAAGHCVIDAYDLGTKLGTFIYDPVSDSSAWLDLPAGVTNVWVSAVNIHGKVVGSYSQAASSLTAGFVTEAKGSDTVSKFMSLTPGANTTEVSITGVNDAGEVLGLYKLFNSSVTHYLIYNLNQAVSLTNPQEIIPNGGANSYLKSVSNSGDLLAGLTPTEASAPLRAYSLPFRSPSNPLAQVELWPPGSLNSTPGNINDVGDVIGSADFGNQLHRGFLHRKGDSSVELMPPSSFIGNSTSAQALNNSGVVVGSTYFNDGTSKACYWQPTSTSFPTEIGLDLTNATSTSANFINNDVHGFPIILGSQNDNGTITEFVHRFGQDKPLLQCTQRRASYKLTATARLTDTGTAIVVGRSSEANCVFALHFVPDTDGDGFGDAWELSHNTTLAPFNPHSVEADATTRDSDSDELSDLDESFYGTDPDAWDTDRDQISDGDEIANQLNPLNSSDANEDADHDLISNKVEININKTDPRSNSFTFETATGLTGDWITPLDINDAGNVLATAQQWSVGGNGTLTSITTPWLYKWNTNLKDLDGDGILNIFDSDTDGDGVPNLTDTDDDNDGIPDLSTTGAVLDTSPTGLGTAIDLDGDGNLGTNSDSNDPDLDGDGIVNFLDPDVDGDGTPNSTDLDDDNDGIPDVPVPAITSGSYNQSFDSTTIGSTTLGDGTTLSSTASNNKVANWAQNNKALQMITTLSGNSSSWKFPVQTPGVVINDFSASFNVGAYRSSATAVPGAGWSLNFGAIPSGNGTGEGGFVMPGGIVIAWDFFNNGGSDLPSIEVFCNGVSVKNYVFEAYSGGTFTLTNPVSGATTTAIAYNATSTTVQTAMRTVSGWSTVTVTGNTGGPWTVDHVALGDYAAPSSHPANLLPLNSELTVKTLRTGTASVSAKWTFPNTLTDSPIMDEGTFTLTNPVTAATTAPIAFNATTTVLQTAMRLVSGWESVIIGGSSTSSWTVDHGIVGSYADPVSDTTGLVPAISAVTVLRTTIGTTTANAKWSLTPRPFRPKAVTLHWDDVHGLDLDYDGKNIFTDIPTPGFVPAIGNQFAFSARTESSNTMSLFLDDVSLLTWNVTPYPFADETPTGKGILTNYDGDELNNDVDSDLDGDGIVNDLDNDMDGDGIPNGLDPDQDNDTAANGSDTTPMGLVTGTSSVTSSPPSPWVTRRPDQLINLTAFLRRSDPNADFFPVVLDATSDRALGKYSTLRNTTQWYTRPYLTDGTIANSCDTYPPSYNYSYTYPYTATTSVADNLSPFAMQYKDSMSRWVAMEQSGTPDYYFAPVTQYPGGYSYYPSSSTHVFVPPTISGMAGTFAATDFAHGLLVGNLNVSVVGTPNHESHGVYSSDFGATWTTAAYPDATLTTLGKCQKGAASTGILGTFRLADGTSGTFVMRPGATATDPPTYENTSLEAWTGLGGGYTDVGMDAQGVILRNSTDNGPLITRNGITVRLKDTAPAGYNYTAVAINASGEILCSASGMFFKFRPNDDVNHNGVPDDWEIANYTIYSTVPGVAPRKGLLSYTSNTSSSYPNPSGPSASEYYVRDADLTHTALASTAVLKSQFQSATAIANANASAANSSAPANISIDSLYCNLHEPGYFYPGFDDGLMYGNSPIEPVFVRNSERRGFLTRIDNLVAESSDSKISTSTGPIGESYKDISNEIVHSNYSSKMELGTVLERTTSAPPHFFTITGHPGLRLMPFEVVTNYDYNKEQIESLSYLREDLPYHKRVITETSRTIKTPGKYTYDFGINVRSPNDKLWLVPQAAIDHSWRTVTPFMDDPNPTSYIQDSFPLIYEGMEDLEGYDNTPGIQADVISGFWLPPFEAEYSLNRGGNYDLWTSESPQAEGYAGPKYSMRRLTNFENPVTESFALGMMKEYQIPYDIDGEGDARAELSGNAPPRPFTIRRNKFRFIRDRSDAAQSIYWRETFTPESPPNVGDEGVETRLRSYTFVKGESISPWFIINPSVSPWSYHDNQTSPPLPLSFIALLNITSLESSSGNQASIPSDNSEDSSPRFGETTVTDEGAEASTIYGWVSELTFSADADDKFVKISNDSGIPYNPPHYVMGDAEKGTDAELASLCFVSGATAKVKGTIALLSKVKNLAGTATVTAKGWTIPVDKELQPNDEIQESGYDFAFENAAVVDVNDGTYLVTFEFANCSAPFPAEKADFFNRHIWKWTVTIGTDVIECAEETGHRIYVTAKAPEHPKEHMQETCYFIGCNWARGKSVEADVIADIWTAFSMKEAGSNYPRGVKCAFDNANFPEHKEKPKQPLGYYRNKGNRVTQCTTSADMLRNPDRDGQCGAWAEFFGHCVLAQGFGVGGNRVWIGSDNDEDDCILVNHWTAKAGYGRMSPGHVGEKDTTYPLCNIYTTTFANGAPVPIHQIGDVKFVYSEYSDLPGIGGQANPNPLAIFGGHWLVQFASDTNRFYDPSYGVIHTGNSPNDLLQVLDTKIEAFGIGAVFNLDEKDCLVNTFPQDLNANQIIDAHAVTALLIRENQHQVGGGLKIGRSVALDYKD